MKQLPKVSVCMITYNHEEFIEEAINGVLMQKCDFEMELVIVDDCSIDRTDEVIKKIIKSHSKGFLIKYIKQEQNVGMSRNFVDALENCKGKYIAVCEGDDFWNDQLKLQKQYEFLENNPQIMGCFHHVSFVDSRGKTIEAVYNSYVANRILYNQEQCLKQLRSAYATCSLFFKKKTLNNAPELLLSNLCDELLDLIITESGSLSFMDFNGGSYRQHSGGVWSGTSVINSNIVVFKRTLILLQVPNFKDKYGDYLKKRLIILANKFLFETSLKKSIRLRYFIKTVCYYDFKNIKTYKFIVLFLKIFFISKQE